MARLFVRQLTIFMPEKNRSSRIPGILPKNIFVEKAPPKNYFQDKFFSNKNPLRRRA
jgi:hypothetical protein